MGKLDGRHALVTGGGSGVGAAIAKALAEAGARLTLVGRRPEPLASTARSLPGAATVTADVTKEDEVAAMVEAAHSAHGRIGILIANAGAVESAPFAKVDMALWQRMLAANLTGAFLSARAVLPDMMASNSGRIVFVASTAGLRGYAYVAPYCAAKHGVVGLARALARETARDGITVNAICPGFTDTSMLERSIRHIAETTGKSTGKVREALLRDNPQGRLVRPEEVASAALWLCAPDAVAVTGQAIAVAGGEL